MLNIHNLHISDELTECRYMDLYTWQQYLVRMTYCLSIIIFVYSICFLSPMCFGH